MGRSSIKSVMAGAVAGAVALLAAAPGALTAQITTQSYAQCGIGTQACYGAQLTLNSTTNTLTLLLQNTGTTPSRITGFGLFENPLSGPALAGTLQTTVANGTGVYDGQTNTLLGLPSGFAILANAPSGLDTGGDGITYQITRNFGSGGIVGCSGVNGGSGTMLETCSNPFLEALQITFTGVTGVTSASQIGLGVRFQSVADANGQGDANSLRCISTNAQTGNCQDVPGGGITGQVVPEPSTYALLGSGLLGLAGIARRRRRQG